MSVDWKQIDTVLLDMDGTLLDLYFDNYFWQQHLPACWAKRCGLSLAEAHEILLPRFRKLEGTLSWYCLDFWTQELDMDVLALKDDIQHLISMRPHAENLLLTLRQMGKQLVLVTNAHPDVIDYKFARTEIDQHFEAVISAHELGEPKEAAAFWPHLIARQPFDPQRTLLIDDNWHVLESARAFGIVHLLTIARPDSRQPARSAAEFTAVEDFCELFPASIVAATEDKVAH